MTILLLSSIALKTSVLLLVVGAVSSLLHRTSAALRHWLWACALAICLAMPLAILWVPSLEVLPSSWAPSGPQSVPAAETSAAHLGQLEFAPESRRSLSIGGRVAHPLHDLVDRDNRVAVTRCVSPCRIAALAASSPSAAFRRLDRHVAISADSAAQPTLDPGVSRATTGRALGDSCDRC